MKKNNFVWSMIVVAVAGIFFSQVAIASVAGTVALECRDGVVYKCQKPLLENQTLAEESCESADVACASFINENSRKIIGKKIPESQLDTESVRIIGANGIYLASIFPEGYLRADVPASISFKLWGRKDGKIDPNLEGPLTEPSPIKNMPDTGIRLADGTFLGRVIEKGVSYLVLGIK